MQVLVVEDDVMLADCLAEALLDQGHSLSGVVSTVAEAVALARQHRPDVAILDMNLSNGSPGSDVVDRLAELNELGQIGVLYVTGEAERVQKEVRRGHACLNKPYTLASLEIALEIVREIACEGGTARPLPRGLRLLGSTPRHAQPVSN